MSEVTSRKKRLTAYIGRFSSFHNGHAETSLRALRCSDKVLVIIGSAYQPRTIKNPWTFQERAQIIRSWYDQLPNKETLGELVIVGQLDHPYSNQKWLASIQTHVSNAAADMGDVDIYLTGSDRDDSTFYLKEFQYKQDFVPEDFSVSKKLSATSIRNWYLGRCAVINEREEMIRAAIRSTCKQMLNLLTTPKTERNYDCNDVISKIGNETLIVLDDLSKIKQLSDQEVDDLIRPVVPAVTLQFMQAFRRRKEYATLLEEYEFQIHHDRMWMSAPYKVTFNTVDAVVVQTGHILLIKRRNAPGKGLWALPGGYLNTNEWMMDGAIRELIEESKIDVPVKIIYTSVKENHIFEAPSRSIRGRLITRAFLIKLPNYVVGTKIKLPKVKGDDDAEKAKWFPISEVEQMSDQLFEDHYSIIETMLGKLDTESK